MTTDAAPTRFAHGFWNPCDLKFDTAGRLIATDNDPDARGPNRVLHVIQGGRYGYRSRFGASGLHPFDSWNGELPGTLPMLAGVGEAPVGVLDCDSTALPMDYASDLMVAVWGTNQVVRVHTQPRGASLMGEVETLISGNEGFRPTGLVATTDGTIYIGDWGDRRYPVHGKGRLWRLRTRTEVPRLEPALPFSRATENELQQELARIAAGESRDSFDDLLKSATSDDAFLASAAITALGDEIYRDRLVALMTSSDPGDVRLASLLALRGRDVSVDVEPLKQLLADSDPRVRRMAMVWLGESHRFDMAAALAESMPLQVASPNLFETFLAASQLLTEAESQRLQKGIPGTQIDRDFDQRLIARLLTDQAQPDSVRAMALRYVDLSETMPEQTMQCLVELAGSENLEVSREAIRTLGLSNSGAAVQTILAIAVDETQDSRLRADALSSIRSKTSGMLREFVGLVRDPDGDVALAAARALGRLDEQDPNAEELHAFLREEEKRETLPDTSPRSRLIRQVRFALGLPDRESRPRNDAEWEALLGQGDAEAGRRVFFDQRTNCAKCHRIDGRGGAVGPDLSNIASSKTPAQILGSILHPSQERSPDYQGYSVVMLDGQTHQGTQFHFRGESAQLLTVDGNWIRFALDDTEDYRALDVSLMPEGLAESISVSEMQDLMSFLVRDQI